MGTGKFDNDAQGRRMGFAADLDSTARSDRFDVSHLRNDGVEPDDGLVRSEGSRASMRALAELARSGPGRLVDVVRSIGRRLQSILVETSTEGGRSPFSRPAEVERLIGDDYWLGGVRPPHWRLALGALLAPIATLAPTVLFALVVYWFSETDHAAAWRMTVDAGAEFFSALYLPLLIGGAFGGAALWALRLRSRRAFAVVGGVLGVVGGGLVYLINGALPGVVAVYALCAGALSLLALRWTAGVRAPV